MKRLAPILAFLALGGCETLRPQTCPAGEQPMRLAQLFFGQNQGGKPFVSDSDFRKFVDDELTPRFPEGLTVLDGGGQWKGADDKLIREASKVVMLVLPQQGRGASRKISDVRQAYARRFHQESVLVVTQKACGAF